MPAWEIGRVNSGLGSKIGGLGVIVEELPSELVKAAALQGIDLEIEILTPCFAHYDKQQLKDTGLRMPVTLEGHRFEVEVYEHVFPDGQKVIYFWDAWQLSWTNAAAIYPDDPDMAYKLFAVLSQAMAAYIRQGNFDTVHGHDYHVGLVPFYLGDEFLSQVPYHFTIHNATYQGNYPIIGGGFEMLYRINLPGHELFHKYFDFFDHINLMKGVLIKTHETGGKITTVSGDLNAGWGYAAELRESADQVYQRAQTQKGQLPVQDVFVPNRFLNMFEQLPIIGITNGMGERNRPENLPELKADVLKKLQQGRSMPLFMNPYVQQAMLAEDHTFDTDHMEVKVDLKRLLHLETFGIEPTDDPILFTVVGRLVAQKNLGLVGDIIERTLAYEPGAKFIILASAPDGESEGKAAEAHFFYLAQNNPGRVYFNNGFNLPLSKLIFAGGDFSLIPSRFEPCGLVDYEASLLGNVVIGRRIGGLAKVSHCAYLYDWLDIGDRAGEANAFFAEIMRAIDTYRQAPETHAAMRQTAMAIDASWDRSAAQYIQMYRYGLLMKAWQNKRDTILNEINSFIEQTRDEGNFFKEFYNPVWGDNLEQLLKDWL